LGWRGFAAPENEQPARQLALPTQGIAQDAAARDGGAIDERGHHVQDEVARRQEPIVHVTRRAIVRDRKVTLLGHAVSGVQSQVVVL
jgi:hypothetical protein